MQGRADRIVVSTFSTPLVPLFLHPATSLPVPPPRLSLFKTLVAPRTTFGGRVWLLPEAIPYTLPIMMRIIIILVLHFVFSIPWKMRIKPSLENVATFVDQNKSPGSYSIGLLYRKPGAAMTPVPSLQESSALKLC